MESVTSIGCTEARRIVDAAIDVALEMGHNVSVAVSARTNVLRAFAAMDGSSPLTTRIAQDKAYTVIVAGGAPTAAAADLVAREPTLGALFAGDPRLVLLGGGEPIVVEGAYVGAIGVSGAPSAELDSTIARAAIGAINGQD